MNTYKIENYKIKTSKHKSILKVFITGTDEIVDVFTSIKCWSNYYGVHYGCAKAVDRILSYKLFLEELQNHSGTVLFGGHSMGGAIAEALALVCHTQQICKIEKVLLFGAYPIDSQGIKMYTVVRINAKHDIVPKLFPWFKMYGDVEVVSSNLTGEKNEWPFKFYYSHIGYDFSYFWDYE